MSLLSLHNISIAFGGPLLLDNLSLDIQRGQRICFLGRNGTGKSTFLKIIAGEIKADRGDIIAQPGLRIAYLPQDVPVNYSGTVFDIVAAGAGKPGEAFAAWHTMAEGPHDSDELSKLQHYLDTCDGWRLETVIKRVLEQVNLDGSADVATLSGGMRRRVLLARALVREPDLLLLDEPTNHLDLPSIAWLENFLISAGLTVLFVTHDRRLLKRIATRIIELDRGMLADWSCDYETFLERKQAVLDAEEREWERFDKKLALEEQWIRRGVRARRVRNEGRVRALKKMREERRKRRERSGAVSMAISGAEQSGERVITARNVSFSYTATAIVNNLSITVSRNDRIGIIGPNGCGKTTLINLLLGGLAPQSGTIEFGERLAVSYFDQLRTVLDPEKTVWENITSTGNDTVFVNGGPRHVISYLQDFLFTADRAKSPLKQLSGGERNRLMLARLFTQPANVLVFDEPTNDLDAETLELLEELLLDFKGTVLIVSHDREFLNNVISSTIAYEGNGVFKEYVGGYDDWERQKPVVESEKAYRPNKKEAMRSQSVDGPKKLSFKEQRELDALPKTIESLEAQQNAINVSMADPEFFKKGVQIIESKKRLKVIAEELLVAFARWEELEKRQ